VATKAKSARKDKGVLLENLGHEEWLVPAVMDDRAKEDPMAARETQGRRESQAILAQPVLQVRKTVKLGSATKKKEVCTGTGSEQKCSIFTVPVRRVACGSQATPVKWGINTLPTSELSINGQIEATGNVHAKTMMVERQETVLGEGEDMSPDDFGKLITGSNVDLGRIAVEMHKQVHTHKSKIARLEALVAKQTAVLSNIASRLSLELGEFE